MEKKKNYFLPINKLYIALIGIVIVILFYYGHNEEATVLTICYVFIIIYNLKKSKHTENQWEKVVKAFSDKMDVANSSTFVNLPLPLIMANYEGIILWHNKNLSDILEDKNVLGRNIKELNKELNVRFVMEGRKSNFSYIKIGERYFDIIATIVYSDNNKQQEDAITLFYFYDVTEKHNLYISSEENKYSIMLIEVDNLNDVLKSTSDDQAPLLAADIERTLNSYAQSLSAVIKKYSLSKYILTIQDKLIEKEIEKKFDILDTIRELNYGNKLAVTLSVGVGRGGDTPQKNHEYAQSAKELSLGRGGDQVVVKRKDNLDFFGGKTKEVEKRTKVKARVIAHALVDLIRESTNIFIMGHKSADIDCLGAAVGIYSTVKQIGKDCNIVMENFNPSIKEIVSELKKEEKYKGAFISSELCLDMTDDKSLLIIVDVHNEGHVESMEVINSIKRIVVIDHHRKAPDYVKDTLLSYIETYASSTSELVTEMLPYLVDKPELKKIEAMTMLSGIYLDTKNFYFKTGVRTFEAAAVLRRLGADTLSVKKMFKENLEDFIKKADIIKSAEILSNIAIAICPEDMEDNVIAAQVADELLNITGVHASFVFVKIEEDIYISGRSLEVVNVQVILESLGGGGHMTMAGAKLAKTNMDDAVNMLKEAISKYLREGE
ncbi:DHH family phosphoesterase [Hathewaya histolytica]|uniref:Cyclic-di-AMP phosphodiesterase n=1 Tax=Hathewaya histolytica TaxID=1498 RepID=A0A4U9RZF1_HATHI|nr:DHH family phosphoesterase [Hathewaya histolytica]VTQ96523.1 signaling protein [Hathewaya histolytica]